MLSKFSRMISVEELRFLAPRVALYTMIGYATVRTVSFVSRQVSRWTGFENDSRS